MPSNPRASISALLIGAASVATIAATAAAQPTNDLCTTARTITSGQTLDASNVGATSDIGTSSCSTGGDDRDVWFRFTAPLSGAYRFEIPFSFDTTLPSPTLSVYSACGGQELGCDAQGVFIRVDMPMIAGQVMLLRVAGDGAGEGDFQITAGPAPVPPPYDECAGAISLVLDQLEAPYVEASPSSGPSCPPGLTDMWFKFQAPQARRYRFTATGGGPSVAMTAYSNCLLTSTLACDDNCDAIGRVELNMSAGQMTLLRVAACFDPGDGNPVVFYVRADEAPATPANDSCAAASLMAVGGTLPGTTRGATGDVPLENCFGGLGSLDQLDVWYRLTNTTGQRLLFSITATPTSADFNPLVRIYDACEGSLLDCGEPYGSNGEAVVNRILVAGESVRLRIAGVNLSEGDFTIGVSGGVAPAVNDDCALAIPLLPGSSVMQTTADATISGPGAPCAPDDLIDEWYTLTNSAGSAKMFTLDTIGSTGIESPSLTVFAGCGGPLIACAWATPTIFPASRLAVILDAHETAQVRIAGALRTVGDYIINVSTPVDPPPAPGNDDCAAAATVGSFPFQVELAAGTAANDQDIACDGQDGPSSGGVWYAIPPQSTDCMLVMELPPLGLPELSLAVFEGSDCAALTPADCEALSISLIPLRAGTPYRLLVTRQSADFASPDDVYRFTLDCARFLTPGETCALATPISAPLRGTFNNTSAMNEGAASAPAGSCNADATDGLNHSLYFRYTAPANGTLTGTFRPTFVEGIAAVYSGTCGSLTEVACAGFSHPLEWSVSVTGGQSYLLAYGANGDDWPGSQVLVSLEFDSACIADFNGTGSITVQDIFDYLAAYFSGDDRADVNGVGGVTVQDIFDFLASYFSGC